MYNYYILLGIYGEHGQASQLLRCPYFTNLMHTFPDIIVRILDSILQDIPTGADSCVTSLASDSARKSLLVAGCGDGSVRLFDRRQPTNCW